MASAISPGIAFLLKSGNLKLDLALNQNLKLYWRKEAVMERPEEKTTIRGVISKHSTDKDLGNFLPRLQRMEAWVSRGEKFGRYYPLRYLSLDDLHQLMGKDGFPSRAVEIRFSRFSRSVITISPFTQVRELKHSKKPESDKLENFLKWLRSKLKPLKKKTSHHKHRTKKSQLHHHQKRKSGDKH
ncbi:MAG: hypothetical protein COX02_01010 [Candidatus Vogelbacteria bacterium CG22_combo_CG10-13_8_21_14_all_37_9]|uniref:Uncharacterized protein n=1 Tax=Candidatus Vogelbacteria bacterium CG22_combo_CG10-13_8_21_14_all_37_9 TaxID=1975046 RepID=A0A2H0BL06_9BACT|nr:MAG: hypothetical protein COX02_01010 [Candidatus Vogelbacteria bacterium CG22_combo_CG10-13_8_21_14_all_37_9]